MFMVYEGKHELTVRRDNDASFQTNQDDFKPQSLFVFCLNGSVVC